MGQIHVIAAPDLAPGFRLAGVETTGVEDAGEAEQTLRTMLAEQEASLVVIQQNLLAALPSRLQRRARTSFRPLVMAIPGGLPDASTETRRRRIDELVREAIGFQITFDFDSPPFEAQAES